jgi:hypothetical protein
MIEALRNGQQCDEDGVMCIVSRQACHEAADIIEAQQARIEELEATLQQERSAKWTLVESPFKNRVLELEAAVTIRATPDTAERRMDEMEAADPNPDDGLIEVGRLKSAALKGEET